MAAKLPQEVQPASFAEVIKSLARRWRWLALGGIIGSAISVLLVARQLPVFKASATLLIENKGGGGGIIGDLAQLSSLGLAPSVSSEIIVLKSRALAERTAARPAPDAPNGQEGLGLDTLVFDERLRPFSLLRRRFEASDEPLVQPSERLRAEVDRAGAGSPRRIRVRFDQPGRIQVETVSLLGSVGLKSKQTETLAYTPGAPLEYRGLTLRFFPLGDVSGLSFLVESVPSYEVVERLMDRVRVAETAIGSGVIEVAVLDSDPVRAAATANALADFYLTELDERGQKRANDTVGYIREQLDRSFDDFQKAQEKILELQEARPELLNSVGSAQALIEQTAGLEVQRVRTDLDRRLLGEVLQQLEDQKITALARLGDALDPAGVSVDPITAGYLQELGRLNTEYGTLLQSFQEQHPLARANRAASDEVLQRIRHQLSGRLDGLESVSSALGNEQDKLRLQIGELPAAAQELAQPLMQLEIHKQVVPHLLRSLQGAEITRNATLAAAEFIDRATAPLSPESPKTLLNVLFGAIGGLLIGAVIVLLRESHYGDISSASELASVLDAPVLSVHPRQKPNADLALEKFPGEPFALSIRALRARLDSFSESTGIVAFAGSRRGEGASSLVASLALASARSERRTLLIDADLDHPAQAAYFALEDNPGLVGLASQQATPEQAIQRDIRPNLDILAAGTLSSISAELIAAASLPAALAKIASGYDRVFIDSPPLSESANVQALGQASDAYVVVHRARGLSRGALQQSLRELQHAGIELLGVALNDTKRRA